MSIKKLSPKSSRIVDLNFSDGFDFGLGFFTAFIVFILVAVPFFGCLTFLGLSIAGATIQSLFSGTPIP